MNREFVINHVIPNSPAEKAGVEPGDRLFRINDSELHDILDYKYLSAGEDIQISIKKKNRFESNLFLKKQYDEDPGLGFKTSTMGPLRKCQNKCIFCFIDQQPGGLRESLYEKDDDYRLSFLYGNYITLTNAGRLDLKRIARRRISPLYISIHSTIPDVRKKMMRNPAAGNILNQMKILARAGIKMHGQIVLCPGVNDGKILENTLDDLSTLFPALETVAIVPVGLSKHRKHLSFLHRVTPETAKELFESVSTRQELFLEKHGIPFVYLADEFYLLAEKPLPSHKHYGAYQQLENGVGLGRLFLNELEKWKEQGPLELPAQAVISLVTGCSAESFLKLFVYELEKSNNLDVQLHVVESSFWGKEVSVAGLITGSDLIKALRGKKLGDIVFIPSAMLKAKNSLFLDDYSVEFLSDYFKTHIIPVKELNDIRCILINYFSNYPGERTVSLCHHR